MTVTNAGPSTATSVAITDAVNDPQVVLVGASTPAGPCPIDGAGARCAVDSLAPGASVVMTVNGLVTPDATPGGLLSDVASVSSATPDGDPSDDSSSAQITVGPTVPGLEVTKTADAPDPLIAGLGEVRYTIGVANAGPSDADPVTVTDILPPGFVVISAATDRGACTVSPAPTGDAVSCDLGRLTAPFAGAPGAQARITITAQVPAAVRPGTYPNTATAQAPGAAPVASNGAPVTVSGLADVSVIKSFPPGTVDTNITPGQPKTYRIRVVNDGPSVAVNAAVTDALPAGLTPTAWRVGSVTPAGGSSPVCDVGAVTCDLGDLPPARRWSSSSTSSPTPHS